MTYPHIADHPSLKAPIAKRLDPGIKDEAPICPQP